MDNEQDHFSLNFSHHVKMVPCELDLPSSTMDEYSSNKNTDFEVLALVEVDDSDDQPATPRPATGATFIPCDAPRSYGETAQPSYGNPYPGPIYDRCSLDNIYAMSSPSISPASAQQSSIVGPVLSPDVVGSSFPSQDRTIVSQTLPGAQRYEPTSFTFFAEPQCLCIIDNTHQPYIALPRAVAPIPRRINKLRPLEGIPTNSSPAAQSGLQQSSPSSLGQCNTEELDGNSVHRTHVKRQRVRSPHLHTTRRTQGKIELR
jgi:hypothetical protein